MQKVISQTGQALLLVILIVVVVATVGLSIASRSITGQRNATEDASSQKAFSAAEAGVERALQTSSSTTLTGNFNDTNKASYNTTITSQNSNEFLVNGGSLLQRDEGSDIWLSDYSSDQSQLFTNNKWTGTLTLFWGDKNVVDCTKDAVLEVIVITGTRLNPVATKYAIDPCSSRSANNNFYPRPLPQDPTSCSAPGVPNCTFSSSGGSVNGKDFHYSAAIDVTSGLIARVIPLYNTTTLGVIGSNNTNTTLPVQGTQIDSTGTADNSTKRRITVYQGYPKLPAEFFQYVLLSP